MRSLETWLMYLQWVKRQMTDWNTWSFVIEICGNYYYFYFCVLTPPCRPCTRESCTHLIHNCRYSCVHSSIHSLCTWMAEVFRNFPGVQASPPFPSMCLVKQTIQEECLSCKISSPPHSHLPSLCPPGHSAHPAYILSPNDPGGPVFPQGVLRFFCKQIVFFIFTAKKA